MKSNRCDVKDDGRDLNLADFLTSNDISLETYRTKCRTCDGQLYNRAECEHYVMPERGK